MTKLHDYYKQELNALYEGADHFARQYPDLAKQLQLDGNQCHDPHILRLLEGNAFLNARLRQKLDDDYGEFTTALLQVLYPHYLAPAPSAAIVQFKPAMSLTVAYPVMRHTLLQSDAQQAPVCHFLTAYDTYVWPIQIASAQLKDNLLAVPALPDKQLALQVLHLKVQTLNPDLALAALAPDKLRLYLMGAYADMVQLYEKLLTQVCAVGVSFNAGGTVQWLPASILQPVGFAPHEALLPLSCRTASGYQLLSEFFILPEKFLFIELNELQQLAYQDAAHSMDIYIYFKVPLSQLSKPVQAANFQLACTPVINLFKHRAEPIALSLTQTEYPIIADVKRADIQVHSINEVEAHSIYGGQQGFAPLYGITHANQAKCASYWQSQWRTTADTQQPQLTIALTDLQALENQDEWTLALQTLASNGTLPRELYFHSHDQWLLQNQSELIAQTVWLTPPTLYYSNLGSQHGWELISHLTLNQLNLAADSSTLRELLLLYETTGNALNQLQISGISNVKTQAIARRAFVQGLATVCQGVQITIDVKEDHYPGQSAYLFGGVLAQVLSRFASVNSFIQLIITTQHFSKELYRWSPRTGTGKIL